MAVASEGVSMSESTVPDPTGDAPSFRATADADVLESALEPVLALFEECHLRFDADGITLSAIDPATVAWVDLELASDAFESFEATAGHVGIDLDRLADVVGMAESGGTVRLDFDPGTRRLRVRIGGLTYDLAVLDPDTIRSPPESTDFDEAFTATVGLDGRAIEDAVAAADMVSDHLAVGIDEADELLYAAAEGDTDTVRLEYPADDCAGFDPGPAHSLFSVSYLDSIASVLPADGPVDLRLGEEAPIELAFDLAGGSVRYVVAPRISRS